MSRIAISNATIESITHKDGRVTFNIRAVGADVVATNEDFDEATHETFKATVIIEGAAEQTALPFEPGAGASS